MRTHRLLVILVGSTLYGSAFTDTTEGGTNAAVLAENLQTLTGLSQTLVTTAKGLTCASTLEGLFGIGSYPLVAIRQQTIPYIDSTSGTSPFIPTDQNLIQDALILFVAATNRILDILIGKSTDFAAASSVGTSVVGALQGVTAVLDTFLVQLIYLCPNRTGALPTQKMLLENTLADAIAAYTPPSIG